MIAFSADMYYAIRLGDDFILNSTRDNLTEQDRYSASGLPSYLFCHDGII